MPRTARRFGDRRFGDVTGAVADLGVMVPLAAALILVNGLDPSAVFVGAGLLALGSGLYFGIPFPVQPLKALTAVAVAQQVAPGVIHAAGLEIAGFLLLLSFAGVADRIARVFTKPVIRALQLGVGVLLVVTAIKLVGDPPDVFRGTPAEPWPFVLAAIAFSVVWWAARTKRYELAGVLLVGGIVLVWTSAAPSLSAPTLTLPSLSFPRTPDYAAAFFLLVVPQLPLTFGNAVVAVTDVAKRSFGEQASRVTPSRVCLSCGAGNVISALIGGVPMCHGAGGLTAHIRLGARTRWMNVGLACAFLTLGLFFAEQVPVILGLLPVWVLAAFLAYAGARHALLIMICVGAISSWLGSPGGSAHTAATSRSRS